MSLSSARQLTQDPKIAPFRKKFPPTSAADAKFHCTTFYLISLNASETQRKFFPISTTIKIGTKDLNFSLFRAKVLLV